jgi:hypothetical protein
VIKRSFDFATNSYYMDLADRIIRVRICIIRYGDDKDAIYKLIISLIKEFITIVSYNLPLDIDCRFDNTTSELYDEFVQSMENNKPHLLLNISSESYMHIERKIDRNPKEIFQNEIAFYGLGSTANSLDIYNYNKYYEPSKEHTELYNTFNKNIYYILSELELLNCKIIYIPDTKEYSTELFAYNIPDEYIDDYVLNLDFFNNL